MTNTNTDRDRFLSVFRREWEMYQTRENKPARVFVGKVSAASSAVFDRPVAGGELRLFADFPNP